MPPKRKSYQAFEKLNIVTRAEEIGNRAAAREYGIGETSIREWRKQKDILQHMPSKKKSRRHGIPWWPELEEEVKEWVQDLREKKRQVSTIIIRLHARKIAAEKGIVNFKGGPTWCYRFMKRHGLSVRCTTSVGQALPTDWKEKVAAFHTFVSGKVDGLPMSFDMPRNRTVDIRGAQDILITTTGAEKVHFTVVLAITADGEKLAPLVIFKRKTMPKEDFPKGVIVCVKPKGWMNVNVMETWVDKVWKRRKGAFFCRKSLLIYDSARSHLTDEVKNCVNKCSELAVIPGGLTKKLQPLDLTVNRSMKCKIRARWEKWMLEGLHTYTRGGRIRRPSYAEVCRWIVEAWGHVSADTVKRGFKRAELVSYGEELPDDDDDEDDGDDISLPDTDSSIDLEEILNLFQDDDKDEDFDGFTDNEEEEDDFDCMDLFRDDDKDEDFEGF